MVDIGGSKSACVIARLTPLGLDDGEIDVLGVGQHGGIVADRGADIETSLRASIEAAERMSGETLKSVHVVVGGKSLTCRRLGVDLTLSGGVVTRDDVGDCLAEGAAASPPKNRLLHAIPVRSFVDGVPAPYANVSESAGGPLGAALGLVGETLTAEIINVSMRDSVAANIETLISGCGLSVERMIAGPIASSEAVLIDDERELGVMLIDVGAKTTDFAIFERGVLTACGGVSLGGENVTRDIAQIFGTPIVSAERIKTFYGSAFAGEGDENRLVDFPQMGDPGEVRRHSRAELADVVAPRLEEIFDLTMTAAERSTTSARSIRRVVLTGGGSLMLGAVETVEKVIGAKARLSRPMALVGAPEAATAPQFSAALGALQYVAHGKLDMGPRNFHERLLSPFGERKSAIGGGLGSRYLGGVGAWLKSNF